MTIGSRAKLFPDAISKKWQGFEDLGQLGLVYVDTDARHDASVVHLSQNAGCFRRESIRHSASENRKQIPVAC